MGRAAYVTTVKRGETNRALTGFIIKVDLDSKTALQTHPIDYTPPDSKFWNSRGGNRGARGVFLYRSRLYVAAATEICVYDEDLVLAGKISNPLFCGLHNLYVDETGIIAVSTVFDAVVKVSFSGETIWSWFGAEHVALQKTFSFSSRFSEHAPRVPDSEDYKFLESEVFHFSGLAVHDKSVYVLSAKQSAVIQVYPDTRVFFVDSTLKSPHDLVFRGNTLLVNNTRNQSVSAYDVNTGGKRWVAKTRIYDNSNPTQFSRAGWQRGLVYLGNGECLIGTSPLTIFTFNVSKRAVGEIFRLDTDIKHCVYSLCAA